ncbi:GH92 family glycosyl hydrolase [Pricia sp.]|uniref:GH92 family glycosyl hydrolase n=1 Tax=Pricia sp. TaxID=2268138 RepID=UPI0035932127
MKKVQTLLFVLALACFCDTGLNAQIIEKPTDYVDPLIDTHKSRWFYFSSASRPFGMVNLSPDMQLDDSWLSGYMYDSTYVKSFSHVHAWQLSGIPVMPSTGVFNGNLGVEATKSKYSHESEVVRPGYHKITLTDHNVTAELTSTKRVGFHQYHFPKTEVSYISFHTAAYLAHSKMDSSYVRKISDTELEGYSLMAPTIRRPKSTYIYFVARFDQPFSDFGTWKDAKLIKPSPNFIKGDSIGAYVKFDTRKGNPVKMKVAIAYTSIDQARKNLDTELPHWDFDRVVNESKNEWNKMLSRIQIEGGTKKQQTKFYTDLWHALLGRRILSDVDGKYCDMTGPTPKIRQVKLDENGKPKFPHYNFDALWGTHWNLNILWSFAYPEIMDGFCNTLVDMYENGGLIPRGPAGGNYTYVMISDPAAPFFATALQQGIKGYDVEKAYEGLRKNAFVGGIRDHAGYEHDTPAKGGGMEYYIDRGYVPEGIKANGYHMDGAHMTLDYSYQDWCLAQMAKVLNKKDDHKLFSERAKNYKKLWDPKVGYIHPRNFDGSWIDDFAPVGEGFNMPGFCESNSAMGTVNVPHDIKGIIKLMGGNEKFVGYLNHSFTMAEPNNFIVPHGKHAESWVDYENQSSLHMAHLFNLGGAPWLTQKWVRKIKEDVFGGTDPHSGYNGDEDQGQLGALGVLMGIGLFQVDGGAGIDSGYEITSPIFDQVTINLNQAYYPGKNFVISTENNTSENNYIQSATLNGKNWEKYHFPRKVLTDGGELKITLGDRPNKAWGTD